ncbi:MAG: acetylornithine deacetylase [Alphaproteobacteria bacterium]|nr:acetylornithine deacetylase [Alphaproteobacteria bacterium]
MTLESRDMLRRLIGFDTTSRDSNLALIHFVRDYLADLGVVSRLVHDETGNKANLYATLGPVDRPGVILSGHTDVVPVDGQAWDTDPFHMSESGGRLYGRGTCDMKGFIAICLALTPEILRRGPQAPLHFAFSYDEEVGCIGVRRLIQVLAGFDVKPHSCIVGEPTGMQVARAHKSANRTQCHVHGLEGHSSLAHQGVNAIEAAAEVIAYIKAMSRRFRDEGPFDPAFEPPYTTINTGLIEGGTATNIIAQDCDFTFGVRCIPGHDHARILAEIQLYAEQRVLPEMRAVSRRAGFEWTEHPGVTAFVTPEESEVITLAKRLALANSTVTVPYATEAGLFAGIGIPTVVCGPGHIEQAHKPNEFVALDQMAEGEAFLRRLMDRVCARA